MNYALRPYINTIDCSANLVGSIDGVVARGVIKPTECCPPTACNISPEMLACAFVDQLPRGPLWDGAKTRAKEIISEYGACEGVCYPIGCHGIAMHAVYAAQRLMIMIKSAFLPVLQEMSPYTAHATLDDWIDRLGWQECIKCACECIDVDAGEELPPWQLIMPDQRVICCPSEADFRLNLAVKHGLVVALWRLRLGIIPNLESINYIISSLGAQIVVDAAQVDPCCRPAFKVMPASDVLPCQAMPLCRPEPRDACTGELIVEPCPTIGCSCHVTAYWNLTCDGDGDGRRIYPGVIAASCIVRSLLSHTHVKITH